MKRALRLSFVAVVVLLLAGLAYERVSQWLFNATRPPAEEFVEVNGRRLHFVKRGEGGPTVVFLGGLGSDSRIWDEVQNALAGSTTTLSYDRAGLLWSDPPDAPPTLATMTAELEALLEKTGCPKPWVVVAHSMGGITARPFITAHRDALAGVVLVDAAHPALLTKPSAELRAYQVTPPRALLTLGIHSGLLRAVFSVRGFVDSLPRSHWFNRQVRDSFFRSYEALLDEAANDDAMFDEAARLDSFGDVPLVVVSAAYPDGFTALRGQPALEKEYLAFEAWAQADLLRLSSRSRQVLATKSDHYVQLHDAALLIGTIEALLGSSRLRGGE